MTRLSRDVAHVVDIAMLPFVTLLIGTLMLSGVVVGAAILLREIVAILLREIAASRRASRLR